MPPTLVPTLAPFQQAIDFHQSRVVMSPEAFADLSAEARLRAFSVSGLARQASVTEAYRLIEEAIQNGTTMEAFRTSFLAFLEANDGALLSDARIDLIFRQNVGLAYSMGRYAQMTDPDVLDARPYWMYPTGPDDSRTTEVCRSLQGFIALASAEVWQHIYPPNHFNERHNQVVSLSAEQAHKSGGIYPGPQGDQYPFLEDPETGQARRIMPDSGFDVAPSLVASDSGALSREMYSLGPEIAAKSAADYGLPAIADLPETDLAIAPELGPALPADATPEDVGAAWQRFRDELGIPAGLDESMVVDAAGDGVIVNRETFDHLLGLDQGGDEAAIRTGAARAQYFGFIRPSIEEPLEIWWVPERAGYYGEVAFVKRYIAAYQGGVMLVIERSPSGWLMETIWPSDPRGIELRRTGYLAYRKYSLKKAAA
jgi:phage-Barnase-EndoU-ColicinE5/D-RelE like nuclease2/Phage Mu protein F like protein